MGYAVVFRNNIYHSYTITLRNPNVIDSLNLFLTWASSNIFQVFLAVEQWDFGMGVNTMSKKRLMRLFVSIQVAQLNFLWKNGQHHYKRLPEHYSNMDGHTSWAGSELDWRFALLSYSFLLRFASRMIKNEKMPWTCSIWCQVRRCILNFRRTPANY